KPSKQIDLAVLLAMCEVENYAVCSTLQSMELSTLKPFPPGEPEKFALFLDQVFGIQ
uniref:Uncharacterized protein n=1 Tax=Amazona collaria TaxID=241587 RepID=A0A8B9FMY4_9PSIT